MIVNPPQNYNYSANSQISSLAKNVNDTMTRTAIILDREAKDIAPVVTLAVPAAALVTFYGKNQAFIPSSSDKLIMRTLKNAGQKTTDFVSNSLGSGWRYSENVFKDAVAWTGRNIHETASELKGIFGGQFSRLGRALKNDAIDVAKSIFRR